MKTRLLMLTAIFHALFGIANAGQGEKVSYPAPAVSGINQDGATVNFADVYKKGPTVVFFYPKADTPGCTKQACSLRDAFADLSKEGVQVLGVSFDKAESQKAFKDKFTLPYDLIADPEGKIVAAFKVEKMAKGLLSLAKRSCFLIKNGNVVWQDYQAATDQQAADIKRVLAETK
ncbi:peroxiredoxin [Prosthecobacter vanneervenii]|uniref:thioredoxin-dependent peroxiredoxin n=1 Tax=Prosthecobacter vanneervenii TaxID=48466 RepID=A0A7W7YEY5_9BACT|nr:peroxiredoxin [Prosthecobacter vanneervenii]MBB5034960.1 peroxiredoxin Q/BCP [Prosthecobacter vanneervenii]